MKYLKYSANDFCAIRNMAYSNLAFVKTVQWAQLLRGFYLFAEAKFIRKIFDNIPR
jgi:hypothetical protein